MHLVLLGFLFVCTLALFVCTLVIFVCSGVSLPSYWAYPKAKIYLHDSKAVCFLKARTYTPEDPK